MGDPIRNAHANAAAALVRFEQALSHLTAANERLRELHAFFHPTNPMKDAAGALLGMTTICETSLLTAPDAVRLLGESLPKGRQA